MNSRSVIENLLKQVVMAEWRDQQPVSTGFFVSDAEFIRRLRLLKQVVMAEWRDQQPVSTGFFVSDAEFIRRLRLN